MQDANRLEDISNIICASNANTKLSFQGWEKCVEAFSQGKGHLSHHCSRLMSQKDSMQQDVSQLDEAISWSSSDGESDASYSQNQSRLRPNRTLSSQINFDDCKPVRQRGRRHTSAQFMRCIEKRHVKVVDACESSFLQSSQVGEEEREELSNRKQSDDGSINEDLCLDTYSHSLEESVWMKNLSLLNQRINISSLSSDTSILHDNSTTQSKALVTTAETEQEIRPGSPILGLNQIKPRKRRIGLNVHSVALPDEVGSNSPNSVPSSPIFKTSSSKKKRGSRVSRILSNPPIATIPISSDKNYLSICDISNKGNINHDENNSDMVSKQNDSMSPGISMNFSELCMSPIIGKSTSKRKKPSKMLIEKSVSPILGCGVKGGKSKKKRMASSHNISPSLSENNKLEDLSVAATNNETRFSLDQSPQFQSNSSIGIEEIVGRPSASYSQSKSAVKRSLDFTPQNQFENMECASIVINEGVTKDAVGTKVLFHETDQKQPSSMLDNNTSNEHSIELNDSFNHSHLIEEINTELLGFENVQEKLVATPTFLKKRKKLSLGKKVDLAKDVTRSSTSKCKVGDPAEIYSFEECSPPREFQTFGQYNDRVLQKNGRHLREKNACQKFKGKATCANRSQNLTLFIEEEFSEPMEKNSQNVIAPPLDPLMCNSNSNEGSTVSVIKKTSCFPVLDSRGRQNKMENEVAIDMFSSQSTVQSELAQIEKVLSPPPSPPSSVTISQTSSPPQATVTHLPSEPRVDDFNAPPRKGKKKLKPDGLASRLQRLLKNQRSSARIWQFKRSKQGRSSVSAAIESRDQSSSILLLIDRTWTEYSHVIVQGHVDQDVAQESTVTHLSTLSKCVIVVLDPRVAENLGRIMVATSMNIFPPWQALKLRGSSVILGASCIEVLNHHLSKEREEVVHPSSFNEGLEIISGISLLDIVYPKPQENSYNVLQCANINGERYPDDVDDTSKQGTISDVVSNHCVGGTTFDRLTLTILRVFQFSSRQNGKTGEDFPAWSLLGQDTRGEICEVVLGCEDSFNRNIWLDVKTENIMGNIYHFVGFLPIQRISPFRVSKLWSILSGMPGLGTCDQSVMYVLGATSTWKCEPSGYERKKDIYHPYFSTLKTVFSEYRNCEPHRVNIICRIIHATNERLYITDMDSSPSITAVTVNPTAYVPSFTARALCILDIEVISGDLQADKYTRIVPVEAMMPNNLYNEDHCRQLANLNPKFPVLHKNSPPKSLVLFFGTIDGVDVDSAFMWPACGICGNEALCVGAASEKYSCDKCNGQCENFTLRMSLQVLATCSNLPEKSTVRIKLLQSTIETLLSPSQCNEEGYDMNAVLGRTVGPLNCEVLLVKNGNFTLQELP